MFDPEHKEEEGWLTNMIKSSKSWPTNCFSSLKVSSTVRQFHQGELLELNFQLKFWNINKLGVIITLQTNPWTYLKWNPLDQNTTSWRIFSRITQITFWIDTGYNQKWTSTNHHKPYKDFLLTRQSFHKLKL